MNQTTNYQLSQWEDTDRILRVDFNNDNAKMDAALKANADAIAAEAAARLEMKTELLAQNLWVKLADVTAPASSAQVNVPAGQMNLTQYAVILVRPIMTTGTGGELLLRVNGQETYYGLPNNSGNYAAPPCLGRWETCSYGIGGHTVSLAGMVLLFPAADRLALGLSLRPLYLPDYAAASVSWEEVETFSFQFREGADIPADSRFLFYGLRC